MNIIVLCLIAAVAVGAIFATLMLRLNGRKGSWHRLVFILSPVVVAAVFGYVLAGGPVIV